MKRLMLSSCARSWKIPGLCQPDPFNRYKYQRCFDNLPLIDLGKRTCWKKEIINVHTGDASSSEPPLRAVEHVRVISPVPSRLRAACGFVHPRYRSAG